MPRKNKRKTEPHNHAPSVYDKGFNAKCLGCSFAGAGFVCLTSDGNCLKSKTHPTSQPNSNNGGVSVGNSNMPSSLTNAVGVG